MAYCIRTAEAKDQASLLNLMKEHALFEGHQLELSEHHQALSNIKTLPITIFVVDQTISFTAICR